MKDLISRADVEQTVEDNILCYTHSDRPIDQDPDTECHMAIRTALRMLRKDLRKLPSAQPEEIALHESCTDCPLYDHDRHSCPRFNKVIPETLREVQPDYTELKQEFLRMASYIDVLLECSDEQKETLNGFISRLSEYMPWTERD